MNTPSYPLCGMAGDKSRGRNGGRTVFRTELSLLEKRSKGRRREESDNAQLNNSIALLSRRKPARLGPGILAHLSKQLQGVTANSQSLHELAVHDKAKTPSPS